MCFAIPTSGARYLEIQLRCLVAALVDWLVLDSDGAVALDDVLLRLLSSCLVHISAVL